jgi:hypothetical protein
MTVKVLVASKQGQGGRDNDFYFAQDREMLVFGTECSSRAGREIDGRCGCRRSFSGLASAKATTTAVVEEREYLDRAGLRVLMIDFLERAGFLAGLGDISRSRTIEEWLSDLQLLVNFAAPLPVGTVVERRGDKMKVRA